MAEAIFCRGRKLAECLAISLRDKQGIISEAADTFGSSRWFPRLCRKKRSDLVAGTRQSDHAPKPRRPLPSAGVVEILQEQCVIFRIRGRLSRIAC